MEQQRPARGAEGQIAQLVRDHHVRLHQPVRDESRISAGLLLLECLDQFDRGEEPHAPVMMLYGLHAQRCGDVGLARPRRSNYILPANSSRSWLASTIPTTRAWAPKSRSSVGRIGVTMIS